MLIDAFIDYLSFEKKYSKHTILAYEKDLLAFKDFCEVEYDQTDIENIHYNQIRTWIVSLVNQNISNRSINRKVSSLKSFYKFLLKIGEIKINPLAKHKSLKTEKKIQVPFTVKELEDIFELTQENSFEDIRNRLVIELLYSTGIRRAELINIKERDINYYDNTIKVLGKRNKERFVVLLDTVKQILLKYLEFKKQIKTNAEELLVTEKGVKLYETLVYRIINSYFSRVSTKVKRSPHMLRHTFATHLLNNGASLNTVKELLGHSSLASTQVYTHNSLEQLKQVYNKTHPREST
ncbi:integrase [Tenacibaculum holothuriorum]|uniref:Tyrosine recombinase XerC n=1 Tax=Tenacibaculum holothuriorum TaxID=1635173 RepID=A0A1Y2PC09_9FLAO|nr:tyrosine-type recombinase/integrase [Tenacibaculum holothuriorum]OSY88013.1 integrase [Tenacibaculum holothuriorum]